MENKVLALLVIVGLLLLALLFSWFRLPRSEAQGVKVTLSEWKLEPTSLTLPPGPIQFMVTNSGQMEHAFEIERRSDHKELGEIEHIAPGQTKALTVVLQPGDYELYCPIPGHKEQGLVGTLLIQELVPPEAAQTPSQTL